MASLGAVRTRRALLRGAAAAAIIVPFVGFARNKDFSPNSHASVAPPIASRGASQAVLFSELSRHTFPPDQRDLNTSGWDTVGIGAGRYVCDVVARKMQWLHPRFCAADASGRYWRLVPENDMILVEQGGAHGDGQGDGSQNDRVAFQSAINYAQAIGIELIGLTSPSYAIWASERYTRVNRFGGGDSQAANAADGHGLVIGVGRRIHFKGLSPSRTLLRFMAHNGGSFASTEGNLQIVNGSPWRGGGIFILSASQKGAPLSDLVIENVILDGGFRRNVRTQSPQDLAWDVTHRGIWCQVDKPTGANITIIDSDLIGWRGESVYSSNNTDASTVVRRSTFSHSNGQGLNVNGCRVDVEDGRIINCKVGIEGWTGAAGGRIVKMEIEDTSHVAVSLQGGKYGRSANSTFYAPTPVIPGEAPIGTIDIRCRRAGTAYIGWWLMGALSLIDTRAVLGDPVALGDGTQFADLDVILRDETAPKSHVVIAGGKGSAGDMLTNNCKLRIVVDDAIDSRVPPVVWQGSLGNKINVSISGTSARQAPRPAATVLDFSPNFV